MRVLGKHQWWSVGRRVGNFSVAEGKWDKIGKMDKNEGEILFLLLFIHLQITL